MELHSSGAEQTFETGAQRDIDTNKFRPDLISPFFEERLGSLLGRALTRYKERNWEKGMPISRCLASLQRHLTKYKQGKTDEDHLAAIAFNAMAIIHYEEMIKLGRLPKELADMPSYVVLEDKPVEKPIGHVVATQPIRVILPAENANQLAYLTNIMVKLPGINPYSYVAFIHDENAVNNLGAAIIVSKYAIAEQ